MSTAFPLAERNEPGYRREQVDEFLSRARASYEQSSAGDDAVTSADIRRTAFTVRRKGYSARHVDAAMDRLEEVFFERERRARIAEFGEESWWAETRQLLSELRGRLERPKGARFRRRSLFASGYRRAQVDAFLDQVTTMLHGEGSLTTADIRGVVFHSEWRGYNEDQVDALLDAVIVLMLSTR
ncbi:DivIVA domain-containing protein [Leucobacter soli]|uniref:Cell wall synthesis protein Wag31 n=1 Tax=Leucobacter soli TaxID=2812850 RepID=A0A916NUZ6_9MICO|nr:DivIVA domain-containing protein [Leucobacter soli]CAG7601602.1 Cell cycle protein GpsB [Leucobacter soli]